MNLFCSCCGVITSNATVPNQTTFSIIAIPTETNWGGHAEDKHPNNVAIEHA
jgi:hypothetical protein